MSRVRDKQKMAEYSLRSYYKHHGKRIISGKANGKRQRAITRAFLWAVKSVPCFDCKKRFPPCCMDFDHVRGKKLFNIGSGRKARLEKLMAEIAKCDIVCSNCHRIRTELRLHGKDGILVSI